jgi:DNA primase
MPSVVIAGSGVEVLEKELITCLLKYGHEEFDFRDGKSTVTLNIADTIIGEMQNNGFTLRNPHYMALYDTYSARHDELGKGVEILAHNFITHPDPEVCNAAVDLLTADDIYTISKLWKRHDFYVAKERERLTGALPNVILLYKSKVIKELSAELGSRLKESDLPEEQVADILRRITLLDRERNSISKRLSRLIL